MVSLSDDKQADITDAFKTTSRYLDVILSIDERCCVCGQAHQGLTVGFLLLQHTVVCTVESLSLFHLLSIFRFVFTRR